MSQMHEMQRRIYYHHTDAGGIVYHAKYFDFCEEGRMEYFHARGLDLFLLQNNHSCHFVAVKAEINWKASAFLNDVITVKTKLREIRRSSSLFEHTIERDGKLLADILITMVCIDDDHKVKQVPADLKAALLR